MKALLLIKLQKRFSSLQPYLLWIVLIRAIRLLVSFIASGKWRLYKFDSFDMTFPIDLINTTSRFTCKWCYDRRNCNTMCLQVWPVKKSLNKGAAVSSANCLKLLLRHHAHICSLCTGAVPSSRSILKTYLLSIESIAQKATANNTRRGVDSPLPWPASNWAKHHTSLCRHKAFTAPSAQRL